jgi:hypothetical protein
MNGYELGSALTHFVSAFPMLFLYTGLLTRSHSRLHFHPSGVFPFRLLCLEMRALGTRRNLNALRVLLCYCGIPISGGSPTDTVKEAASHFTPLQTPVYPLCMSRQNAHNTGNEGRNTPPIFASFLTPTGTPKYLKISSISILSNNCNTLFASGSVKSPFISPLLLYTTILHLSWLIFIYT